MKKWFALILSAAFGFVTVTGYAATTTATASTSVLTAVKSVPTKAAPKVKKQHKLHKSGASKKMAKSEVEKSTDMDS